MPVHVFVVDEKNYEICVKKGLAAIPNSLKNANISDGLISRMAVIKPSDFVLFYVIGKKELRGVFKVLEFPFYDENPVWENNEGQCYPFRVRIDNADYSFTVPIKLSDIYDLKDNGVIWTFALKRPSSPSSNAMFSISDAEFKELLNSFFKLNPNYSKPQQIREPYPYFDPDIMKHLHFGDELKPKYEYTLMALIMNGFARNQYKDIFGNYTDFLGYVPTSFEREIDLLLIFDSPVNANKTIAYNIIEVKRDEFDDKGLTQLLQYEDWFLKKKVNGDSNMLRTTAIASSFSDSVIDYLQKRKKYEAREALLLTYKNTPDGLELIKKEV